MSLFLYENHWGSPTLTLLNELGVLGVLNMLNVLNVLDVLDVLYMPMDASLAYWALFETILTLFLYAPLTLYDSIWEFVRDIK